MVIQMVFGNGQEEKESRIYRDVVKNTQIAQYREGFYSRQLDFQWGFLYQLKGKDKIVLGQFGASNG